MIGAQNSRAQAITERKGSLENTLGVFDRLARAAR